MIGNKANNLIRLRDEFQLSVPDFLIIPFDEAIEKNRKTDIITLNNAAIDKVHLELEKKGWGKVSFRTSALQEDGERSSFAGQYKSFVDITYSKTALKKYIIDCYKSTFSEGVRQYACKHGLELKAGGSLIVQEMFYGKQSGVIFSEDGNGNMHIVYTDSWKNAVVENESAKQYLVPKISIANSVAPSHMRKLANEVSRLEQTLNMPLDIEWSYDGKSLVYLQMRPQTTTNLDYDLVWDSTNISENYPGTTLPLTYSFIRSIYAQVYPEFLQIIGINKNILNAKSDVFENMLGYLNGHVYYRISNWYKLVELIPGRHNQVYFESMLNPVKKRGALKNTTRMDVRSTMAIARFIWVILNSPRISRKFTRLFSQRYGALHQAIPDNVNANTIFYNIQQTKSSLLELWAMPVLNDFRTMVFHGMLKKQLLKRYSHEEYLQVLQGLTKRASIKPLQALQELGDFINSQIKKQNVTTIDLLKNTESWQECIDKTMAYTKKYSARTPDELKLESVPITENIEDIMILASHSNGSNYNSPPNSGTQISTHGLLIHYLAKNTRQAIDWRESFRFNRAQVFRMASDAYLVIGKRFSDEGIIDTPRDIYYLYEREIEEIINGHTLDYNAKYLVTSRKNKIKEYESCTMSLLVSGRGKIAPIHLVNEKKPSGKLQLGTGVSNGKVSGYIVVATTFNPHLDISGKILVVTHIDPGWTLLFTQAVGVITERGNALSHVAIVARELGIPAIVGAQDSTTRYKNGDFVIMDGLSGEIILEKRKTDNK
ncbi:MAG: PEP/pyruvate-binding domain-containing protein [Candidatus Saccharibacteria bacterium]